MNGPACEMYFIKAEDTNTNLVCILRFYKMYSDYDSVNEVGSVGMAPCCVHTKAEVSTAF